MHKKLFYILLVISLSNIGYSQRKLALVTNGTSKYQIVLPTDANAIEKQSATVLQDYLQKISKAKLPVVQKTPSTTANQIIIGRNEIISQSETEHLGGDGFIIRKVNNSLILAGGNRKGTLYAVYTFLEDYLGCKMYTPKVIDIPNKTSIVLGKTIRRKETPSFAFRSTFYKESLDHTYADFHKMNYFFEDWGLFAHTFENLLPKAKYFEKHPEYYALVKGKRTPAQLCLTNPEVLGLVIQNLEILMKAKPDLKHWSVSQNDNDKFCECDNCQRLNSAEGSFQGSILPFVNNVAKHFPDKTISTLAYRKSEKPPKSITPLPNVLIMLCTSYNDRRKPLADQTNLGFYNNFKNWSAITTHLFLWDYITEFTSALSPFPNVYTIQPNVQYFASKNVTDLFLQGIGDMPAEFSELRCYMAGRLMWNKDVDIQSTINEFTNGYYGPVGARYINEYITSLDKNASAKPIFLNSGGSPLDAIRSFLSQDNIQTYKSIFNNALNATAGTVYHDRILKEYLPVLYAELEINRSMIGAGKINFINKQTNNDLLNDFYKKSKQLNISYLNEARSTIDNYYKKYNDLLNNTKQ